jgi:hypothetical protein
MPDRNQSSNRNSTRDFTKPATELNADPESSQSIDPFVMQTQRGQGKEDGDPSQECDQPLEEQDIRS